jgi:phosphoadenosine phosphosulfate reductase
MMVESCQKGGGKRLLHPIIDWSDSQVWEYIHERNLSYCKLYDEGFKRLGCIMCPMQGTKGMLRDAARWPKYYQAYLRSFERMLERKREQDSYSDSKWANKWRTAQDVMDWWIYHPPAGDPDQGILFE